MFNLLRSDQIDLRLHTFSRKKRKENSMNKNYSCGAARFLFAASLALSVYSSHASAYPVIVTTDKVRCSNGSECLEVPGSYCSGGMHVERIQDNGNGTYVFTFDGAPDAFCRRVGRIQHKLECQADYTCKRQY